MRIQLRIESRLVKGSTLHLKNVLDKSKLIRTSNEAAEKIAEQAKVLMKKQEEKSLNDYVEKFMRRSKMVKDVKKSLQMVNDHQR